MVSVPLELLSFIGLIGILMLGKYCSTMRYYREISNRRSVERNDEHN